MTIIRIDVWGFRLPGGLPRSLAWILTYDSLRKGYAEGASACERYESDYRAMRCSGHRRRPGGQHGRGIAGASRLQGDRVGEGAPSTISHRRVAPADESSGVRTARRAG